MTLNTHIYILDQVDPHEVFDQCKDIVGIPATGEFSGGQLREGAPWSLSVAPGQGFDAWLRVTYLPDEPLMTAEQAAAEHDDCDEDCDGNHFARACWMKVNFETGYSYAGPDGEGCGALHAKYIAQLGLWLAAHNLRWQWRNEFTGDVYDGFEGLPSLVENSIKAEAWFNNIVRPVLDAEAAASGVELEWH